MTITDPDRSSEHEIPDLWPPGKLLEVMETGYRLNHSVGTTWRPARVVRRDGTTSWLVVHDDCECWAWDDEEGQMRPARFSTYLRYPVTRLIPPVHKAILRAGWWVEGVVWSAGRVYQEGSGRLFNLVGGVSQEMLTEAIGFARSFQPFQVVDLDLWADRSADRVGSSDEEPSF